jgi:ubiquinone/menaquinone biosynthesis C-methylase UbiE
VPSSSPGSAEPLRLAFGNAAAVTSRASSFGQRAAEYDRVRPEYPREAIDLVVSRLGLGSGSEVLDLGAGTGKLTRPLAERVGRVVAVEPDPSMRAVLSRATVDCEVLDGRAETIPLGDRSVDAVLCGQAFHWFATEEALAEIARVLRPGGGLALIWNEWWKTEPPVPPAAAALMQRVYERPDLEPHSMETDDWRASFARSPFEELREERLESAAVPLDAERLVTLILSTSVFGSLPPEEFDAVEAELRRLVGGDYRLPLATSLHWTRLAD